MAAGTFIVSPRSILACPQGCSQNQSAEVTMSGFSGDPLVRPVDAVGDTTSDVAIHETDRLIGSDRVEGTAVYDRQNNHLGSVQNVMIDKFTGQVAYVVISFGGILGMGKQYHPLPWKTLHYEHSVGGYVIEMTCNDLEKAPHYAVDEEPWTDARYGQTVDDYYHGPYGR
jgi:sporulation protein YlmC with PRC-barrel domain